MRLGVLVRSGPAGSMAESGSPGVVVTLAVHAGVESSSSHTVSVPADGFIRPASVISSATRPDPAGPSSTVRPPASTSRSSGPNVGPHGPLTAIPRATTAGAGRDSVARASNLV